VVFPEGGDERALRAAALLRDQQLLQPTLLGDVAAVRRLATSIAVDLAGIEVRDPAHDASRAGFAAAYQELRKHKGVTLQEASERIAQPHYFGASMVRAGEADGMVSGLDSATKPFLPAFEIVR